MSRCVRQSDYYDYDPVLENLSAFTISEIEAFGGDTSVNALRRQLVDASSQCVVKLAGVLDDDTPVALLSARPAYARSLQFGFLATDQFDKIAIPFALHLRRRVIPLLFAEGWTRLECRGWCHPPSRQRFAQMCGLEPECRIRGGSMDGKDMIQFAAVSPALAA